MADRWEMEPGLTGSKGRKDGKETPGGQGGGSKARAPTLISRLPKNWSNAFLKVFPIAPVQTSNRLAR